MTISRLDRLFHELTQKNISLMAFNPGASLTYLTGLDFHLMERPVVLFVSAHGKAALVHPALETNKLNNSRIKLESFAYGDNPRTWVKSYHDAAIYLGYSSSIGIEPTSLRLLEYRFLESAFPGSTFLDASPVVSGLRNFKDTDELMAMRKAVAAAQAALLQTLPIIKPGLSEKEVAAELTIQLLRAGSQPSLPFNPIVASGPNSANPHSVPSDRPLQSGDLLIIDWGARVDDYCSDLTRTFGIGAVDPELEKIYRLVEKSNEAGRMAVRPGASAGQVDQAARSVIQEAGYGDLFFHRTGHGLGMEAHESPYIYNENNEILSPGMTFTIEPGIYLSDLGGVRIEDNVLVTQNGMECLSDFPRHLQLLS